VTKFLETKWNDPLTVEERAQLLNESGKHVWSDPASDPTIPMSADLNVTGQQEAQMMGGSQNWPVWSEWPWQDSTHQRKDFSSLPRAPNMEGHYWLKKSYSTLSFDIPIDEPIGGEVYIWIWLVRGYDLYNRYLTVWFDHHEVSRFIIGIHGFKGYVHVPSSMIEDYDRHMVELSISYGGHIEQGWRLEYCWVGIGLDPHGYNQKPPLDLGHYPYHPYSFTELVPRSGLTDISVEYRVLCGPESILNIETENVDDPYYRLVDVYVEGIYKSSIISPGPYYVDLDDYSRHQSRTLKLVFRNMPDIDYPKRIVQLAVHHLGWTFEIDRMPDIDTNTVADRIQAMNAWFEIHSYHRVDHYFSGVLADDYRTETTEHRNYWTYYYEHKFWSYWEYVVWVNRLWDGTYAGGWHLESIFFDYGIGVSWVHGGPKVIWHEYGHHINVIELNPGEVYCSNLKCVMSTNHNALYYCWYHWHLRTYA
jgi:hypothetical protein